jgi:hypothetical protein
MGIDISRANLIVMNVFQAMGWLTCFEKLQGFYATLALKFTQYFWILETMVCGVHTHFIEQIIV